jgi:hypothetical protein
MHPMDTDLHSELRSLRARAYGPAADIERDPVALRRLHELERLLGAPAAAPAIAEAAMTLPEPTVEPPSGASIPAAAPSAAETVEDEPAPAPRPRLSRGIRVLWAMSLVAAAAIAGGAAYGLAKVSPVAVSSGAPQIATLEPTSTIDIPSGWMGAGPSSAVYEFHGLVIFESIAGYGYSHAGDCLTAVPAEELPEPDADLSSYSFSGSVHGGCRVGVFPATVTLSVDSGAPEALRAEFPDSALQFVKVGDQIGVFLDDRGGATPPR